MGEGLGGGGGVTLGIKLRSCTEYAKKCTKNVIHDFLSRTLKLFFDIVISVPIPMLPVFYICIFIFYSCTLPSEAVFPHPAVFL